MTRYIYEEKTAPSAPICAFDDGLENIATKSIVVTIPPTLDGVSSVTETQTGRNLFDKNATPFQTSKYIVSTTPIGSNDFTYSGNANYNVYRIGILPSTTYTMSKIKANAPSWGLMSSDGLVTSVTQNNGGTEGTNVTFTTGANDNYLFVRVGISGTYKCDDILQLELGSTAHDYEPYQTPTQYTASLGRTIYGGEVDIVNGTAEPMNILNPQIFANATAYTVNADGSVTVNGSDGRAWTNCPEFPIKAGTYTFSRGNTGSFCDIRFAYENYATSHPLGTARTDYQITVAQDTYFKIKANYSGTGATITYPETDHFQIEKGSTATAYSPYFTPFTFTGQEVPTRLGYNAFWSDSGDTEVTYYIRIPIEEKYIINGETLSDIADAIREKKESSAPILTEDMADEILSIEMGGSDLLDLASQSTFDFTDDTYKTSALTIPDRMFNNNQRIRTVNISGIKTVESYAFIQCKATSLSFPDVETIGYQAFFQCRGASDVPLSIPNVVTIGEEAFKEAYVCGESTSNRFLDISKCVSIGHNAFRSTRINGFKMDSVETLGNNPWFGSWFSMTTVVFPKLKTAREQMCRGVNFTNLVIGPDWESCGGGFAGYDMDWRNKYVYVYAITPPTMGGDFSLWKPPVAFYVPADSVDAYKAAPYWSQYASIILPLPSDHLTIDTWL